MADDPSTAQSPAVTAVILAGGRSRRMGRDKSFIRLRPGGPCLVEMVIAAALPITTSILISTNAPEAYRWLPYRTVADKAIYRDTGPLAGLEAGLSTAQTQYVVALGCDMPFVVTDVLRYLLGQIHQWDDAVVPLGATGQPEPLCAIYRTSSLAAIHDNLDRRMYKLSGWLGSIQTCYIPASALREFDPLLRSFENLNTPQDVTGCQLNQAAE